MWAFTAGLTANLLVGDPLGSIPLAMLLVAILVAGGARLLGRVGWIYPIVADVRRLDRGRPHHAGITQLVT